MQLHSLEVLLEILQGHLDGVLGVVLHARLQRLRVLVDLSVSNRMIPPSE